MLIHILIIIVIAQTYSLNTAASHNRIVRHKTDYKVNISMADDDIEMVDKLNFSKTYKKKSHRTPQTRVVGKNKFNHTTMYAKIFPTVNVRRVDIVKTNTTYSDNSSIRSNYTDATSEEKTKEMFIIHMDSNKTPSEKKVSSRTTREISTDRVWSIVQIWMGIYILLAIPLWCTIGRCCCCLVCKCFKAQETIREAKLYAMWNPPGVLRKSTGDVIYTPSENEKEAYEQLEHLIRTL